MDIIVSAFYKYAKVSGKENFKRDLLDFCDEIGIKGRILLADEGINGSISGNKEQIKNFKSYLKSKSIFPDIEFKDVESIMHPFKKMVVKVKSELVRFEQDVDLKNTGEFLSPIRFSELMKDKDSVILDARNDYEWKVGKFKNSVTLDIKTFREFPKKINEIRHLKEKRILMYCTGGIRCEKASAYLKEKGFSNVYQLNGGILAFGKKLPDSELWQGKCFVFDKRLVSNIGKNKNPITNCFFCSIKCDLYKNCAYTECDDYCIVCIECEKKYGGCCSLGCFEEMMNIKNNKNKKLLSMVKI